MNREVMRTRNFVAEAAAWIDAQAWRAFEARGRFRIALSGGHTPQPVFREIAGRNWPWKKTLITFSDERCVSPASNESNYHSAEENLLAPARVPKESVRRLRGEIEPAAAANEYETMLAALAQESGERMFVHDLVLLGMGDDGHTASLFPGTAALEEKERGVVANHVAKLNADRLTFTFPMIFAAQAVCFLIGPNKNADLIERVFSGDRELPAARADAGAQRVTWIIAET